MITCWYTVIKHKWDEQKLADKLALLPPDLQQQLLRKRQWMDRQLSLAGKLLLLKLLEQRNSKYSMAELKYNSYRRPYFDGGPDFNIAHSGNIVIFCAADQGQVGIDIEQINELDFADFTDFFTINEWTHINKHPNKFDRFYNFWTKKEAVLKAIGSGFHTPLNAVDVSGESLIYDNITYQMTSVDVDPAYKCHLAATVYPQNIRLQEINF